MRAAAVRKALLVTTGAVATVVGATSAESADRYLRMAPVRAYLMDKASEIQLAKSAAPAAISSHAEVLVLTPTGYRTAIEGKHRRPDSRPASSRSMVLFGLSQCRLAATAAQRKADCTEAKQHHRPSRWFRDAAVIEKIDM